MPYTVFAMPALCHRPTVHDLLVQQPSMLNDNSTQCHAEGDDSDVYDVSDAEKDEDDNSLPFALKLSGRCFFVAMCAAQQSA